MKRALDVEWKRDLYNYMYVINMKRALDPMEEPCILLRKEICVDDEKRPRY